MATETQLLANRRNPEISQSVSRTSSAQDASEPDPGTRNRPEAFPVRLQISKEMTPTKDERKGSRMNTFRYDPTRPIEITTPEEEKNIRQPAQMADGEDTPDRNGFVFANDEIPADLGEPDAAPRGQIRPIVALSPQCPDEKDLWLANGFVMADAEIIASLHYITCPPIIHRRGFQWRAPECHPGSRKNKRMRGNMEKRAA